MKVQAKAGGVKGRGLRRLHGVSKAVFAGRVFSVYRHVALEPGGVRAVREVIHHRGSAVILPRLPDGRIMLIRQFRLAAGRFLWELPAGSLDPGETALRAARRSPRNNTGACGTGR